MQELSKLHHHHSALFSHLIRRFGHKHFKMVIFEKVNFVVSGKEGNESRKMSEGWCLW